MVPVKEPSSRDLHLLGDRDCGGRDLHFLGDRDCGGRRRRLGDGHRHGRCGQSGGPAAGAPGHRQDGAERQGPFHAHQLLTRPGVVWAQLVCSVCQSPRGVGTLPRNLKPHLAPSHGGGSSGSRSGARARAAPLCSCPTPDEYEGVRLSVRLGRAGRWRSGWPGTGGGSIARPTRHDATVCRRDGRGTRPGGSPPGEAPALSPPD